MIRLNETADKYSYAIFHHGRRIHFRNKSNVPAPGLLRQLSQPIAGIRYVLKIPTSPAYVDPANAAPCS